MSKIVMMPKIRKIKVDGRRSRDYQWATRKVFNRTYSSIIQTGQKTDLTSSFCA